MRIVDIVKAGALMWFMNITVWGAPLSLTLPWVSGTPGTSVTLDLYLANPGAVLPAVLQWNISYDAVDITELAVTSGPMSTAAGKSVQCNMNVGSAMCIDYGFNVGGINDGVIARVIATLSQSPVAPAAPVIIYNGIAADAAGYNLAAVTNGGGVNISVPPASPTPEGPTLFMVGAVLTGFASRNWLGKAASRC